MVSGGGQGRLAGDWAGSGPPGALWHQARVGPLGSFGWASQGTRAEKVSLAGCHPQGSLHAWPRLPHRGSDSTAGWVAQPGAQARALHRPLLPITLSAAKPLALLPKYLFLIHSSSNEGVLGCILPTQDSGGQHNRQAHPARRSFTHLQWLPMTSRIRQTPKGGAHCQLQI